MAINDYLRTSSLDVEGNLNFRRVKQKRRYNEWLLGTAERSDLGHPEDDGNSVSEPPSWVQSRQGENQAFQINTIGSLEHEMLNLNVYSSGSVALEMTAVPASGTEYYSKRPALTTKTYYLTSSIDLSGTSRIGEVTTNWGNMFQGSPADPCIFKINVPEYGKIQNIRVWVEILNNDPTASPVSKLQELDISLRSPNVSNFMSAPWLNGLDNHPRQFTGANMHVAGAFILWERQQEVTIPWGDDIHIRTVFDDASTQRHARHYDPVYRSGSSDHARYLLREGSPNWYFSSSILEVDDGNRTRFGDGSPWITDLRIVSDVDYYNLTPDKSPPVGWLTGEGGVAASYNEFPTTGSNLGPSTMRPLYPLLDSVTEHASFLRYEDNKRIVFEGTRPGLRGTEMHGDWELIVTVGANNAYAFFRQYRLEITYGENYHSNKRYFNNISNIYGPAGSNVNRAFYSGTMEGLFEENGINLEGGAMFEINELLTTVPETPWATVGITSNTGSSPDYAVFTRVTGSLSDRLTSSLGFQHSFLNNDFGTPYIPLSSGSGEQPSFNIFSDPADNLKIIGDALSPKPIISRALVMRQVLANKSVTSTTRDLISSDIIENSEDDS